jgi:hypothetical protein
MERLVDGRLDTLLISIPSGRFSMFSDVFPLEMVHGRMFAPEKS